MLCICKTRKRMSDSWLNKSNMISFSFIMCAVCGQTNGIVKRFCLHALSQISRSKNRHFNLCVIFATAYNCWTLTVFILLVFFCATTAQRTYMRFFHTVNLLLFSSLTELFIISEFVKCENNGRITLHHNSVHLWRTQLCRLFARGVKTTLTENSLSFLCIHLHSYLISMLAKMHIRINKQIKRVMQQDFFHLHISMFHSITIFALALLKCCGLIKKLSM